MEYEKIRNTIFYNQFNRATRFLNRFFDLKAKFELSYWRLKKLEEKIFNNNHYEYFYTSFFNLDRSFYRGKSILDIGCGPRGSLEWVHDAAKRIGLDPLSESYQKMNKGIHNMVYVNGTCEDIPFESECFDLVSSFNSLDHVDDVESCIEEISRVLKPGGLFLLIVDIHDIPTVTEPSNISWHITGTIKKHLELISENHFEGHRMYKSLRKAIPFNHDDQSRRYGILTAKFKKH